MSLNGEYELNHLKTEKLDKNLLKINMKLIVLISLKNFKTV